MKKQGEIFLFFIFCFLKKQAYSLCKKKLGVMIDIDREEICMNQYRLLPEEQEVSIVFNKVDDKANMYVSYPAWIRKMDRHCKEQPEFFKCKERGDVYAKYELPKQCVSVHRGRVKVELSPEEKQRRSDNMKEVRKKRKRKTGEVDG